MIKDNEKLISILRNVKGNVEATVRMVDGTHVDGDQIGIISRGTNEEFDAGDDTLRIEDIESVDISKNVLFKKNDPLFDAIKGKLGYKMHESEIWWIVNYVRGGERQEENDDVDNIPNPSWKEAW